MVVGPRVVAAVEPKVVAVVELKVAAVGARELVFPAETGPAQPATRQAVVVAMRLPETRVAE